jgi:hypothetical protein
MKQMLLSPGCMEKFKKLIIYDSKKVKFYKGGIYSYAQECKNLQT